MRYIAIYQQSNRVQARGFMAHQAALHFLGWSYEDNDLIPLGIYDAVLLAASAYQHPGESVRCWDVSFLEEVAQQHIWSCPLYPDTPVSET